MRRALVGLVLAFLATVPVAARADANAEARFYFERGNEELARGMRAHGPARAHEIQSALSDYLQSLGIVRSRNTVYNLAICYEELGRLEDAFDYFSEYLRSDINDAERTEAQRHLDLVRPRVALLEISSVPAGAAVHVDRRDLAARGLTPVTIAVPAGAHRVFLNLAGHTPFEEEVTATIGAMARMHASLVTQTASLRLELDGPPADLWIDGTSAGTAPRTIALAPGAHDVRLRRDDREARERVTLSAGEERTLHLALTAAPLAGGLAVRANVPAAQVMVDGVSWGIASITPRGLVPGRHTVEVSAPRYQPVLLTVEIVAERPIEVHAQLALLDPPRRSGSLPVVTGIAAGVSLLTGAIVGLTALKNENDLEDIERGLSEAPTRDELTSARRRAEPLADDIETLNVVADVCFIGAVALGGLTLTLLATSGPEGPTESDATIAGARPAHSVASIHPIGWTAAVRPVRETR